MKTILVPTDFSANAMKAAFYAAEIARQSGATVYFLHVPELGHEKVHQPFSLRRKYDQLVYEERLNELQNFDQAIRVIYKQVKTKIKLLTGSTVQAICKFCDEHPADLIVMGTQGASGLKEVLFGSLTARVIAKTKVPVLAVPAKYSSEKPDAILLAINYFEQDLTLLNKVVELSRLFSATIHVFVLLKEKERPSRSRSVVDNELKEYLVFLKRNFQEISFEAALVVGTDFGAEIERYAQKNGVDIIAMIPYPKTYWDSLMQKSTTQKMAFHSRLPILAIPPIPAVALTATTETVSLEHPLFHHPYLPD